VSARNVLLIVIVALVLLLIVLPVVLFTGLMNWLAS
jgi:hypothetical protein